MPELPDLAILADALDWALVGRRMTGAKVPQTLVLRGTPAELAAFDGQLLKSVRRRGKFLVFDFDRDQIVFNPMLTGRLGLAAAGAKPWTQWAAAFYFSAVDERARNDLLSDRARDHSGPDHDWPGDADWLPARDLGVEMRYRDATRMGKIYRGRPMAVKSRKELLATIKPAHWKHLRPDNGDLPDGWESLRNTADPESPLKVLRLAAD